MDKWLNGWMVKWLGSMLHAPCSLLLNSKSLNSKCINDFTS